MSVFVVRRPERVTARCLWANNNSWFSTCSILELLNDIHSAVIITVLPFSLHSITSLYVSFSFKTKYSLFRIYYIFVSFTILLYFLFIYYIFSLHYILLIQTMIFIACLILFSVFICSRCTWSSRCKVYFLDLCVQLASFTEIMVVFKFITSKCLLNFSMIFFQICGI